MRVYNNDQQGASNKEFPNRGAHSLSAQDKTNFYCTIPLPNGDPADDLPTIDVVVYSLSERFPGSENILTPNVLKEYTQVFKPVQSIAGKDIQVLLNRKSSKPKPPRKSIGTTASPTITTLHRSGTNGSKWNITIVAEGFTSSTTDQDRFNNFVENTVMDMLRRRDIHPEILNGINVFRINTFSQDSGVTRVNSTGAVTTDRRTAFDIRYSGDWNRCWMEDGPNSLATLNATVNSLAPQTDSTIVVLNQTGSGGCARGARFYITRSVAWSTVAHEFGHSPVVSATSTNATRGPPVVDATPAANPGPPT